MRDLLREEATRRVDSACSKIASAYRLATLDPVDTLNAVKSAINEGMEQAAEDVREAMEAAR